MTLTESLQQGLLLLDAGMGTYLQAKGLAAGQPPEQWNLTHPDAVVDMHTRCLLAGSSVLYTNTFGANRLHYPPAMLRRLIEAAVTHAKAAIAQTASATPRYVALDIGPLGRFLAPFGELSFEEAVSIFAEVVQIGAACGVDLIVIETMADAYETKAAVLAAKENASVPIFVTHAYDQNGRTLTGATPQTMVPLLEGLGVSALGVNCGFGAAAMTDTVKALLRYASVPVIVKPNAGLPKLVGGRTVYEDTPETFAREMKELVNLGVRAVGGCCGTTPEHIRALAESLSGITPPPLLPPNRTVVTSYVRAVELGKSLVRVGNRLHTAKNPPLREALSAGDDDLLIEQAERQVDDGAELLLLHVSPSAAPISPSSCPGQDERACLSHALSQLQATVSVPLLLDAATPAALARAMRVYNGKPMVRLTDTSEHPLQAILPLLRHYGGTLLVPLSLPSKDKEASPAALLALAEGVLSAAGQQGIAPRDIVFDLLPADLPSPERLRQVLRELKSRWGVSTLLTLPDPLPDAPTLSVPDVRTALECGIDAVLFDPTEADLRACLPAPDDRP
ncbi:MAG: homocysteine S-methyltransferase family protein [Eubacteriales bacterium]